jgi:hypothetical protein
VLLVSVASELLVLSLDLVKNRVVVMGADMRKNFIGTVLVGLIEKSPDIKIMKAITKVCVCLSCSDGAEDSHFLGYDAAVYSAR